MAHISLHNLWLYEKKSKKYVKIVIYLFLGGDIMVYKTMRSTHTAAEAQEICRGFFCGRKGDEGYEEEI